MIQKIDNYKIAVHITFYIDNNYKLKILLLTKILNSYLKISKKIKLFVHTNKKLKNSKKSRNIIFIYYNLKNEDPHKLSWKCRRYMFKQKNLYDFFVYSEDDILFSKHNFLYWLQYKDLCIKNNLNLGFIRSEKSKKNITYSTDLTKNLSKFIYVGHKKFVVNDVNPYCAFWIYDRKEFNKFVLSKSWNFKWRNISAFAQYYTREMSGIGWHGLNMTRYDATVIPLYKKQIYNDCLIKHLSNKFINNSQTFGTIKIRSIISKKLKTYKKISSFERTIMEFIFFIYRFLLNK